MTVSGARLALLALLVGFSACASGPRTKTYLEGGEIVRFDPDKDPYWSDPHWDLALLKAIQASVHDPVDPADISTPDLHAVVKFTLVDGVIEYPEVVQSTGRPDLDKLMLHQIVDAHVPRPSGLQSDQSHEFVLPLDMPTPYEEFEYSVFAAIDSYKVYTKEAIITGAVGITTVDFDYLNGIANNVTVTKSSKSKELDKTSVSTILRTNFPSVPSAYADKTLHMQVLMCYALNDDPCPADRNVIEIRGTRLRRIGF